MTKTATKTAADQVLLLERDPAFWQALRSTIIPAVLPTFLSIYLAGAEAAVRILSTQRSKDLSEDELVEQLQEMQLQGERIATFVRAYATDWYMQLERGTRNELIGIIDRSRQGSWSLRETVGEVQKLFGAARAERVAVTETTRLFGAAQQDTYKQYGVQMWDWRTNEDERVDIQCDQLAAGSPYPMSIDFIPAHVNCRCWPAPTVIP